MSTTNPSQRVYGSMDPISPMTSLLSAELSSGIKSDGLLEDVFISRDQKHQDADIVIIRTGFIMTLMNQIREHRTRFVKTLALYLAFIGLGMSLGIVGPTLLDLKIAANAKLDEITWALPGRAGGYSIGSLIAGLLYNYVNIQWVFGVCLAASTGLVIITPMHRTLKGIIGTLFANGITTGVLDAAGNMFLLHIWGKESPPFMQALHLFFGFGALLAPILSGPFLVPLKCDNELTNLTGTGFEGANFTAVHDEECNLRIQIPYSVVGILMALGSIAFFALYAVARETPQHPSRDQVDDANGGGPTMNIFVKNLVIVLTTLFMHVYCGLEIAMGSLLTTYAVKSDLHLDKVDGANLTALFWATFTFFRIAAVFYIDIVGSEKNLYFELALVALSNVFLLPFANTYAWCLWTGVAILGIGMSSIWASIFGFVEYYFPVTSRVAAGFLVAACAGEFIFPFLMGNHVDDYPPIFLWITFGCSMACCLLFGIISFLCKKKLLIVPKNTE